MDAKSFMRKKANKDVFLLMRHNEMPCLRRKGIFFPPNANSLKIEGGTHNESKKIYRLSARH